MSEQTKKPRVIEASAVGHPAPFGPLTCGMPDLSDITSPIMLDYVLNGIFRGAGPTDPKAWAYTNGFIRVVDKAIFEYEAARATLTEFCLSRNRPSLYLRAVAHLETCIGSAKRAQRLHLELKKALRKPGMPRRDRKTVDGYWDAVKAVRDAIEHMEEWIGEDKFVEGDLITLAVTDRGDAARIASHTIGFDDLAELLRALHAIAVALADYHEEAPHRTPDSDLNDGLEGEGPQQNAL